MDIGRDVITKAITSTEAESVFQPWWVTVQHYFVYSLVVLGLIAVPINCMLGTNGNCSYDYTHPHNYALPHNICRMHGNQLVIESRFMNVSIKDIMNSFEVVNERLYELYDKEEDVFLINLTSIPTKFSRLLEDEYVKMHLQINAAGCYTKKNPRLFPFHIYWHCVNQLSWLVLYFPYIIFGLAMTMVLLERVLTRFFWTGQRIEKFYQLLVKDILKEGLSVDKLHTRERRLACQQVLHDFRNSGVYYRAYICQTIGKLTIASLVMAWSLAKQCNQLRTSYRTTISSRVQGYWHQCTIPANGMNLVIFDLVNVVLFVILISSLFNLIWYIRILLPYSCHGMIANTKLSKIINKCKEDMRPFPETINNIYFKSLDMRLLLNILTETQGLWSALTVLSLFDPQFRQLFKPQLEKVSSTAPMRGRKNFTVRWREPYGALLASLSIKQGHMMYVAEVSPPSENDDFQLVPACNEVYCTYSPGLSEENNNEMDYSVHNEIDSKKEEKPSLKENDITVVESLQNGKSGRQRRKVLYTDDSQESSTAPYTAVFKNLKLGIDYKITIGFLLGGHSLGVVDFTILAEKRKTSSSTTSTYSSDDSSRKVSDISCMTTDTNLSEELRELEEEEEGDVMKVAHSREHLNHIISDCDDKIVALILGAAWCQVCMRMLPGIEKMARDTADVVFIYMDYEKDPSIKEDYSFAAFPTIFILQDGKLLEKIIGDQRTEIHNKLAVYSKQNK